MDEILNKRDLISEIASRAHIPKVVTSIIINTMIDLIVESLSDGKKVRLTSLGSFSTKIKPEHAALHPATQEPIVVPERKTVKFTPSEVLRNKLRDEDK